jgi:uncharacterized protein (TIGR00725 family)
MEWRRKPRIGVMGPSVCTPQVAQRACEVGRCIARRGGILICGGMSGAMEAAARGAREAGGLTVGILPGSSAMDANLYIDIPIVTGMGNARNAINILSSQAIIAIQGSFGTLSEIALALKCGVPVVGLGTWKLEPPTGELAAEILCATSPEEAVDAALHLIRS